MYNVHPSAMQLLLPLYNSPQRSYHDFDHIQFCISKLSEYDNANQLHYAERMVATYAIWFHDAVYSPYPFANSSNERESADLFMKWFTHADMEVPNFYKDHRFGFAADVCQAITATENHGRSPTDFEKKNYKLSTYIMLDVDMAGFTKPFSEVYQYSERIFSEYAPLGIEYDIMFNNRISFLNKLLSKDRIYLTEYFYDTYEAKARENIKEVIARTNMEVEFYKNIG